MQNAYTLYMGKKTMHRGFVMRKSVLGLLSILLLSLTFLAFDNASASMIDDVKKRKVMRVGFSSFVPWAMQNKAGEFIGFEIDVATRLAKDLGVRLQLSPTAWAGIIPALNAKKFDIIIGGLGISEERAKQVDFTDPYDYARFEVLVNNKSLSKIKKVEDINNKDVMLSARIGTTAIPLIKEVFPNAQIRPFTDEAPAVEEVLSGRVDAFVSSAPLPAYTEFENPEKVTVVGELKGYEQPIGMALRKNDPETLKVLNEWIAKVKAEGWLDERVDYWFRTKNWESQL